MRTLVFLLMCGIPSIGYSQVLPGGCYVPILTDCTDLYPDFGSCEEKECATVGNVADCLTTYTQHTWDTGFFNSARPANTDESGFSAWQESWGVECSYSGKCWCDNPEMENCRLLLIGEWWDPTYYHEIHWDPVGPPFTACIGL